MSTEQLADSTDLIARVEGKLGHLTLNRPQRINALSIPLIAHLQHWLTAWENDPVIELVLVDGAGERGLCAGGDIKALYEGLVGGELTSPFFEDEYALDGHISRYRKPYVALMDGITMGGGVGIASHGSVRVVTERSVVAMPETAIGLFPDVGACYLLARAPGELGTHLALTGTRCDAALAIHAGLADHFLHSERIGELTQELQAGTAALDSFAWDPAPVMDQDFSWVDECYAGDDAQQIVERLASSSHPAANEAADVIRAMSPTSVAVTLEAVRRAASMTVDEVLAQDLMLVKAFARHPDLVEGIRAQVIDKDRNPHWQPATLAELSRADVLAFFG